MKNILDKPIKAKTIVKKIKDMNNKSGDCLDKEFEYYEGLNKRDDKALQDKDKPVDIEKLEYQKNMYLNKGWWNILLLHERKINEIIDVVNKLDKLLKGFHRSDTNKHNQ